MNVRAPAIRTSRSNDAFDGVRYFTLKEAKEALLSRAHLRPRIEEWWASKGWDIPQAVRDSHDLGVLTKAAVATRRYEDALFLEYTKHGGFTLTWITYNESVLSTESPFKRRLLHPTFFELRGKRSGIVLRKHRLASIEAYRAKPLSDIVLNSGTLLLEYHRQLHSTLQLPVNSVIDLSHFYKNFASDPRKYYWGFFSFFLAHCVMIEDYHGGEEKRRVCRHFTNEIMLPVYRAISRELGIEPIIVRFPWHENLKYYMPEDVSRWREHGVIPEKLLDLSRL